MTDESVDSPLLAELSEQDKPWDRHKADSQEIALMYYEGGEQRRCEKMLHCAYQLQFALLPQENDQVSLRLKQARFCRQRHCPICSWRKAMMWRSRILKALHPSFDKNKTRDRYILEDYPTARFLHLTLTVRNPPMQDLKATCKLMSKAWDKLARRRTFPGIGWVRALEITRSKDNRPHPHYHVLIMVPASYFNPRVRLPKQWWIEAWRKSLKVDYDPSIDIKAVKPKGKVKVKGEGSDQTQGLDSGVIEVLKYDIKSDDLKLDPQWLIDLTSQMANIKGVTVGGVFKEYINEDEPSNFIHSEDESEDEDLSQYPQWWFGWREKVKHYQRDKIVEP